MDADRLKELEKHAKRIRLSILKTVTHAGVGHTGGSLSEVELLTVLYHHSLKIDPQKPDMPERDRFILSKGHASVGLYCALAERGYFPEEKLKEFDEFGGMLQGHPCMLKTPGVDMSTGSLGQGLSCGIGIVLGGMARKMDFRVFVMLGCGESQEGQVWEAAMFAGVNKLDRLIAIVDYNEVQLSGNTKETISLEPVEDKWRAFNWDVFRCDGHSISELVDTFDQAVEKKGKPKVIIAKTTKGKGVSFMENTCTWHAKAPTPEEFQPALKEVGEDD